MAANKKAVNKTIRALQSPNRGSVSDSSGASETSGDESESESETDSVTAKPKKLIEDESRAVGHVGWCVTVIIVSLLPYVQIQERMVALLCWHGVNVLLVHFSCCLSWRTSQHIRRN